MDKRIKDKVVNTIISSIHFISNIFSNFFRIFLLFYWNILLLHWCIKCTYFWPKCLMVYEMRYSISKYRVVHVKIDKFEMCSCDLLKTFQLESNGNIFENLNMLVKTARNSKFFNFEDSNCQFWLFFVSQLCPNLILHNLK